MLVQSAELLKSDQGGVVFGERDSDVEGLYMVLSGTVREFAFGASSLQWEVRQEIV